MWRGWLPMLGRSLAAVGFFPLIPSYPPLEQLNVHSVYIEHHRQAIFYPRGGGGHGGGWMCWPQVLAVWATRHPSPPGGGGCSGERPIGAAKGKCTKTVASCQTPPPRGGWRCVFFWVLGLRRILRLVAGMKAFNHWLYFVNWMPRAVQGCCCSPLCAEFHFPTLSLFSCTRPLKRQQNILGHRGQQVPEWRGVFPPNYSQWGFLNQVLVGVGGWMSG